MTYLQYKAAYFGEEKVAHEFTLEDLNEEDKEALYSGLFHIQKDRDRAGRLVIYIMAHMLGQWKLETLVSPPAKRKIFGLSILNLIKLSSLPY